MKFTGKELITLTLKVGRTEDGLICLYSPKDNDETITDFKDEKSAVSCIMAYSPLTAELLRQTFQYESLKKEINGQ